MNDDNINNIVRLTHPRANDTKHAPNHSTPLNMTSEQMLEMYKRQAEAGKRALDQLNPLTTALLSKGLRSGLYSDITIKALGTDFHLHQ